VHPAVGLDGAGGVFRILVVTLHHVVAAHHDLTRRIGRKVEAGFGIDGLGLVAVGLSGAADLAPRRLVRIGEAGRVGLGHAEGFDHADAEFGFKRAVLFRRQRRGSRAAELDARDIETVGARVVAV
jgi:hypothetical protein